MCIGSVDQTDTVHFDGTIEIRYIVVEAITVVVAMFQHSIK
jgi:hypothetical protein